MTENHVIFLLSMLDSSFGGRPAVGTDPDSKQYVTFCTCKCEDCDEFKATHNPGPSDTVVGSMINYAAERSNFNHTQELLEQGVTFH